MFSKRPGINAYKIDSTHERECFHVLGKAGRPILQEERCFQYSESGFFIFIFSGTKIKHNCRIIEVEVLHLIKPIKILDTDDSSYMMQSIYLQIKFK